MERGVEVDIHLTAGIPQENFAGEALGNLAAFQLARERGERLEWQVLRVEGEGPHHFRLIVRHPERRLDWGLARELGRILDDLSKESLDELRHRMDRAVQDGLRPVPLRHLRESVDYWQDDFWNWLG